MQKVLPLQKILETHITGLHKPFLFEVAAEVFLESDSAFHSNSANFARINVSPEAHIVLECEAFLVKSFSNNFCYKSMLVDDAKQIVW